MLSFYHQINELKQFYLFIVRENDAKFQKQFIVLLRHYTVLNEDTKTFLFKPKKYAAFQSPDSACDSHNIILTTLTNFDGGNRGERVSFFVFGLTRKHPDPVETALLKHGQLLAGPVLRRD